MTKECNGESKSGRNPGRRCGKFLMIHKKCGGSGCYNKEHNCSNALQKENSRCRYCNEIIYDWSDLKYDE